MSDRHALRIIDASRNRIREALRVIEDYVRFAHNDDVAGARIKQLRHDVRQLDLGAEWERRVLAARDVAGDVGREHNTASELQRDREGDILAAAFGRITEAARSFAEYAKLLNVPSAVQAAESIRYRAYEVQQAVQLRSGAMQRFRAASLYVILTESLCTQPWQDTLDAVLSAGVGIVQIREKGIDDARLMDLCRRARYATRQHDALLIVNDRPDIALLVEADGVHVGQDDLAVGQVRQVAGGDMLVGRSTHNRVQIDSAIEERPDYIAVGPMFPTTTKPQDHIAGIETLHYAVEKADVPLVAIGGIEPQNAPEIRAAGATVCVCSAVIASENPAAAVARFEPVAT